MERHIRIKMDAHICCLMDRHIRITMGAYIYSGLMARNIRKYGVSHSVPHVLVSAGILESMPAGVGRISAVLTSGNAAATGPVTGVAGSAADEVWTGNAVLF